MEIANSAGVKENVYYGCDTLGFAELSDSLISDAGTQLAFGISGYFQKNGIKAMQNGEKPDAEAIQSYFLKNY